MTESKKNDRIDNKLMWELLPLLDLEDVVREGAKLLKVGGKMYMVHRPFRLIEIISEIRNVSHNLALSFFHF